MYNFNRLNYIGCKINGKCEKIGFTWKNETACKWYKCDFDEETGDASQQVTQIGIILSF